MQTKIKKAPIVIVIITICLYLPLMESWGNGTLWGVNWQSPAFMAQLGDKLRVLKLVLITLAFLLLIIRYHHISDTINNKFFKNIFIVSGFIVAIVQIPLLCLGILLAGSLSANLDYSHKELKFSDRTIYAYTADPGAMGKAYHYFYLKCKLPLNRYELKLLKKLDWMPEYSIEVHGNTLIITNKSGKGEAHLSDITNFNCKLQP